MVTKYQPIAKAGKKLLRTDIPQEVLPAFVELGLKVKNAKVANVDLDKKKNFPNGRNPDYEAMAELVAEGDPAEDQAGRRRPRQRPPRRAGATGKPTTSKPPAGGQQDLKRRLRLPPGERRR